jgi:hypothetical protein
MKHRILCLLGMLLSVATFVDAFAPSSLHPGLMLSLPSPSVHTAWKKNDYKNKQAAPIAIANARLESSSRLHANPISTIMTGIQALHGDSRFVLTGILWLSAFGISLERRTVVGKALSAPLATMALALAVANLGLLPFASPVCKF